MQRPELKQSSVDEVRGVQYDAGVIQTFANRLYARARSTILTYTILGAILGLIAGGSAVASLREESISLIVTLLGGVLGGALGYSLGKERAFALKLQAQTALCQAQIERNTHR